MEKLKRSYTLPTVKKAIKDGRVFTPDLRVIRSANQIGFSETEVYDEILELEPRDFYKSMTEYFNHRIWQDVYKKEIRGLPIYIKFQIVEDRFLLRSFKIDEKE